MAYELLFIIAGFLACAWATVFINPVLRFFVRLNVKLTKGQILFCEDGLRSELEHLDKLKRMTK